MELLGLIVGGFFTMLLLMALGYVFISQPGYILVAGGIGMALVIGVRALLEKVVSQDSQWEE